MSEDVFIVELVAIIGDERRTSRAPRFPVAFATYKDAVSYCKDNGEVENHSGNSHTEFYRIKTGSGKMIDYKIWPVRFFKTFVTNSANRGL